MKIILIVQKNAQVIEDQLPEGGCPNRKLGILATFNPFAEKLDRFVPHGPLSICANFGVNRPLDGAVLISFN